MPEQRKGELFIAAEVSLWGLFPIITVLTYASVPAVVSFLWSTAFAALFFAAMLTYYGRWSELRSPLIWKYSAYSALCIGVLFYGFYFFGLQTTTPGNAAIIALFEVFTAFIFFSVLDWEIPSPEHTLGAMLMVLGAGIVLAPNFSGFNVGDFLILAGTLCAPVGNYFQQKARMLASSETIMFLRSVLSLPFIAAFAYITHVSFVSIDVRPVLCLLLINGVVLLGLSKILWIEAIHRMSVPKATALQALDPFLTLLFAWAILFQAPTGFQLVSLIPFVLGVALLTDQIPLKLGSAA